MDTIVLDYFKGDVMASDVWTSKYQMKDSQDRPLEESPDDMHLRIAKEFGEIEYEYVDIETNGDIGQEGWNNLSQFGRSLLNKRTHQTKDQIVGEFFEYMKDFKYIVPQGGIMANLGNDSVIGSLSNCFTIASPSDSYAGICRADQELVQLMKRRGGVGTSLNNLRPEGTTVSNSAKTSTGAASFMDRFSNSTREVAQDGRRGALMLLLHVNHPDIFKFVTKKNDKSKVTGANVSVMFTDEFMNKVEKEQDFLCVFPVDIPRPITTTVKDLEFGTITGVLNPIFDIPKYNELYTFNSDQGRITVMNIKAKELYDTFTEMAWSNGEPGAAFIDRIQDYCPEGVYEQYKPTKCNPCGEIWMPDYDACRLIAQNLFSIVENPFTDEAKINMDKLYEVSYMQQRMSDNLVDLEVKHIDKILRKLISEQRKESNEDIKFELETEIRLWKKVENMTLAGRRTGNGITGLGDMLAALGLGYDSDTALLTVKNVMHQKMKAELDATIDMAILRGTFKGWNANKEWTSTVKGQNNFYEMLRHDFPDQAMRMMIFGRRNVSWSTVAPTGSVSILTQTTGGIEPVFKAFYTRRRKITHKEAHIKSDFTDQNGDNWQEYSVLHPKFKEWIEINSLKLLAITGGVEFELLDKTLLRYLFEKSPYYKSEAEDISWEKRIEMQSIIQRYTSNSISSTINLPQDIPLKVVHDIYLKAWKSGLKGITVYREGSRTGVLISDTKLTNCDEFGYTNAIKRPRELEADYYHIMSKGKSYAVIVGLLNSNPYEIFAFSRPMREQELKGKLIKIKSGVYSFQSSIDNFKIDNIQLSSDHTDEKLLTRWVSLLLRHGASPKFITEQIEKSEVQIVSFAKAVGRVLKKYIEPEVTSEVCPNCNAKSIVYSEGCKKCTNCGDSKC